MMLDRLKREGRISYANRRIDLVHRPELRPVSAPPTFLMSGQQSAGPLHFAEQVIEDHIKVSTELAPPGHE
jgi:hypothetical protein